MLRQPNALPRTAMSWLSQIVASVGASLVAAMILHAVPHDTQPLAPSPEVTSGGKFAARIESAVAYDGLDRMPVPERSAPAVVPAAFFIPPVSGAGEMAPSPRPSDLKVVQRPRAHELKAAHAPATIVDGPHGPAVLTASATVASGPSPDHFVLTIPGRGLVDSVATSAQQAWSLTTSTGSALLTRLIH